MPQYLAFSPAPAMPRKLHIPCDEPAIIFGDIDWSHSDMRDDESEFSIVEAFAEARAVRMVSAGRPTLVQLLKREHSVDRAERLPLNRPATPARSVQRTASRTPSRETINSDLSSDRKTFSSIDTLCRTPALSHDDGDCGSPTSETLESGPHTPSEHSFDDEREPALEYEPKSEQETEPHSAVSDSHLLLTHQDSFKQRVRLSRLRLFPRRSSAHLSPIACTESAPASPVSSLTSPSRLSLTTNFHSMKTKLAARGSTDCEKAISALASQLTELATTGAKSSRRHPRIRRIESRLGLNAHRP